MSPGLVGSELAATPPQYSRTKMEESLFPPIVRKSALSIGSEHDPSDFCNNGNNGDRKLTTRGSVPASLSSSPIKFPTIDRANSTSVASLPGSRAARHRSQARDIRASYCRSPSCPSHLDGSRNFSNLDFSRFKKDSQKDLTIKRSDSTSIEETMKLPNIFSKNNECNIESSKHKTTDIRTNAHDKPCDQKSSLSLRRSESMVNAFETMQNNGSASGRDPQRNQTAALLLPIRGEPIGTRKKKKKRRPRGQFEEEDSMNMSTQFDDDEIVSARKQYADSDDALDAIARENTYKDGSQMASPRAIEVNSSRSVKQWVGGNRNSQKEGQIKV